MNSYILYDEDDVPGHTRKQSVCLSKSKHLESCFVQMFNCAHLTLSVITLIVVTQLSKQMGDCAHTSMFKLYLF